MIDTKKVFKDFFSEKKNIIVLILVIILVLLGFYFYQKTKTPLTPEQELEKIFQQAEKDASSINLTEEQRVEMMAEVMDQPGAVLPSKEARERELEIIRSLYQ
jgi:Tfp pilus assembly protein PilO